MVVVDGEVQLTKSRVSPPPIRTVNVDGRA
jgi:hypothetical protein